MIYMIYMVVLIVNTVCGMDYRCNLDRANDQIAISGQFDEDVLYMYCGDGSVYTLRLVDCYVGYIDLDYLKLQSNFPKLYNLINSCVDVCRVHHIPTDVGDILGCYRGVYLFISAFHFPFFFCVLNVYRFQL